MTKYTIKKPLFLCKSDVQPHHQSEAQDQREGGQIGVITPPLGTNVYVVKAAAGEDVTLEQIFAGIFPFFLAYVVAVAIVLVFPSIALWLPGMMK